MQVLTVILVNGLCRFIAIGRKSQKPSPMGKAFVHEKLFYTPTLYSLIASAMPSRGLFLPY